jgi:hypothetical protein
MNRRPKRPRGFYARQARARGVPLRTVYLELNPDKRPRARTEQESDDWLPWTRLDLVRMDRAFCDAMCRAIARGAERPNWPAAKPPAARVLRRLDAVPLRSGATSPAEMCAEIGEPDPFFDMEESGEASMDTHAPVRPETNVCKIERLRTLALQMLGATAAGLTADEIAARLGESVLAVRPRVSELFHAGVIEKTGNRRRNASGLLAHVWKKAAAGAQ